MEYENFIIERNVKMINLLKEIQVKLTLCELRELGSYTNGIWMNYMMEII